MQRTLRMNKHVMSLFDSWFDSAHHDKSLLWFYLFLPGGDKKRRQKGQIKRKCHVERSQSMKSYSAFLPTIFLFFNFQLFGQLNVIPLPRQINFSSHSVFISRLTVNKITPASYDSIIGEEGYKMKMDTSGIYITANTPQGFFYASETLNQLIQADSTGIPVMNITDYPAYKCRGMHLDVSRHFFPKEVIEQYLDLMAQLKMNIFHWHLTDDQGWRIEIKKYPKLTETGAWRIEKDGSRYGGYYTQQDIREIVAYAAARYITIVPEIEMPGHSSAAIAAYPELSCQSGEKKVPTEWGVFKDIFCPNDFTSQFLRDVLDEVCSLFPGKYIHLGGDEAPKNYWKKSEVAQALMKKEDLRNEEQLQAWFMKKMQQYIAAKGKQAIGWGEVIKGGIDDSLIVMSWVDKKAGKKAAKQGAPVIMTPRFFCYFDYPQSLKDKRPSWWMTYLPLRKVYRFKPVCKSLSAAGNKRILGGQANVWTEHITNNNQLWHHIYPRLCAMSEALWNGGGNFKEFKRRLTAFRSNSVKTPVKKAYK